MSGDLPLRRQQTARGCRYRAATYNAAADPIHAPVEAQPACLQGEMREYQVEGLRWMVSRLADSGVNAILADEMARPRAGRSCAAAAALPRVPRRTPLSVPGTQHLQLRTGARLGAQVSSAPCMLPCMLRSACGAAGRAPPGTHAVRCGACLAVSARQRLTWRSWARAGPGQDAADDLVPELHADRARRGRALAGGGPAVRAAVLDVRVQALGAQHARRALPLQRRPGAPAPAPRGAPGAGAAGSRARLSLLTARSLRHCARPVLA